MTSHELTPDLLLRAYAAGFFPMAETREAAELYWVEPDKRGVIPIDGFHVPRRLRRTVAAEPYRITVDQAFPEVVTECAAPGPRRQDTWINATIERLYADLHALGFAHSVEAWRDGRLAGGLYGVRLGGAFFGESMFSRARDASKISLVHLVARLRRGGFRLLDAQFYTPHLGQFGASEIDRDAYREKLAAAIDCHGRWEGAGLQLSGADALQAIGQTS